MKCFTLDTRSLSAFRIGLGLVIFWDLIARSQDLVAHYTDLGVYPRSLILAGESLYRYSFHFAFGDAVSVAILFILHALIAILFMIGWHTRMTSVVLWIFTLSLHNRNYMINQGGDVLIHMLLLWSIFLPIGQYLSVDSQSKKTKNLSAAKGRNKLNKIPLTLTSVQGIGLILQILSVYFFSGLLKMSDQSWQNGLGVYYALGSEQLATPLGAQLARIPWIVLFATYSTVLFEFLGPLLYFIPSRKNVWRSFVCASFIAFHLITFMFLEIGVFPLVGCAAWLALFPSEFWDHLQTKNSLQQVYQKVSRQLPQLPHWNIAMPLNSEFRTGFSTAAAVAVIYITLIWNVHSIVPRVGLNSQTLDNLSLVFGLDQKWSMFTKPIVADGWFVIPGMLEDGNMVSLRQFRSEWAGNRWHPTEEVSWDKPSRIVDSIPRDRWRKFMMNMYAGVWGDTLRMNFAKYICRTWNRQNQTPKQLEAFHIYFVREDRLATFENAEPRQVSLWKHECFTEGLQRWNEQILAFSASDEAPEKH